MQQNVGNRLKRKIGLQHTKLHARKIKKINSGLAESEQTCDTSTSSNMETHPLSTKPREFPRVPTITTNSTKLRRIRYYSLRPRKLQSRLQIQTDFLKNIIRYRNVHHPHYIYYTQLAQKTAVCRADPHSSQLGYFFVMAPPTLKGIRGTCKVQSQNYTSKSRIPCLILGMEYRQSAKSFRLYLGYKSPARYYEMMYIRFLLYSLRLPKVILDMIWSYTYHPIVRQGYEIVGAHFISDPKLAKGPSIHNSPENKESRKYTNLWNGYMNPKTLREIQFMSDHSRRDVQIIDLRVQQNIYDFMRLKCS